jgi:uncharacterized protein (UPF0297 family)
MNKGNQTKEHTVGPDDSRDTRAILEKVYRALEEKGYNPVNQLVGYLLSGDPAYITNHLNARSLIRQLERDELLEALVREYLAGFSLDKGNCRSE